MNLCHGQEQSGSNRRRGQALLFAVLLMVFVALLGATFIVVVSQNLNSTARVESKEKSLHAAMAGLQFIDDRLVSDGLTWRPKNEAPPPLPDDISYFDYYDAFDRAEGWATTGIEPGDVDYERDGFVKYPDPRTASPTANSFMARIERLRSGDVDNSDGKRTGMLRITIIGRDEDNPATFTRLVRYKNGAPQHAIAGAMRTVTNWDFSIGDVPHGEVASASGTTIELGNMKGTFPLSAFYVMIGDPRSVAVTGNMPRAAAVQDYNPSSRTLTLAAAPSPVPAAGERVEMCATLGAPGYIDYDNSSSVDTTAGSGELAAYDVAGLDQAGQQTAGGVRVNGSLLWQGDIRASGLQSAQNGIAAALNASGLIEIEAPQTTVTTARTAMGSSQVALSGAYRSDGGATDTVATAGLTSSASPNFPGPWTNSASTPMTVTEKAQLADDGWNRLAGSPSPVRNVQPVVPPDLSAERWRSLTKFSAPASGRAPNSARFGYGQGIYLDNRADRERIGVGTGARDMAESEFRQMLFDETTTAAFTRLGTPAIPTEGTKSLEEKHLRGWIGPDEFRARGVLIELNADATLTITRDSRSDEYPLGLSPAQSWPGESGDLLGDSTAGGVYVQRFAWPENGVVFAEGNVRVRGVAKNPPCSLTVVSLRHIFIEGTTAIDTDNGTTRKLLLLARNDVVLNPTQTLARIDEQTILSAPASAGATQIEVRDVNGFDIGDWITLDDSPTVKVGHRRAHPTRVAVDVQKVRAATISTPSTARWRSPRALLPGQNRPTPWIW